MRIFTGKLASRGVWRSVCSLPTASRCNRSHPPGWPGKTACRIPAARNPHFQQTRFLQSAALAPSEDTKPPTQNQAAAEELPAVCSGCGAFAQWIDPEEAGYYDLSRRAVRNYIRQILAARQVDHVAEEDNQRKSNDGTVDKASAQDSAAETGSEPEDGDGSELVAEDPKDETRSKPGTNSYGEASERRLRTRLAPPVCDRCHDIVNHNRATPIPVPPISYIRDVMDESPYNDNHVYHVLDAADFPLSLIPNIQQHLDVQEQRSKNRRSKPTRYRSSNKLATHHFIITRSDLLAPTTELTDGLMRHVVDVLRNSMGPNGDKIRLGNVRMVSAHRGWWTTEVKKDIWKNGGAIWMVGKMNVGKSRLLNAVFPKSPDRLGRTNDIRPAHKNAVPEKFSADVLDSDPHALLPPQQKFIQYPELPLASSTPGTTASPIRIPFGAGRGEVIDLPGLERGGLGEFVHDDHKHDLIMKSRVKPERLTVKPEKSLLLDGLIRITNLDPDISILAAPFITLQSHVTSTKKAGEMEGGTRHYPFERIAKDETRAQLSSAGVFELKWDVTSVYGLKARENPKQQVPLYRMMGVDILIEGSGWIELVCQVRTKGREPDDFPKVEVFTPQGKCVGSRMSLCTWSFVQEKEKMDKKKRKKTRKG